MDPQQVSYPKANPSLALHTSPRFPSLYKQGVVSPASSIWPHYIHWVSREESYLSHLSVSCDTPVCCPSTFILKRPMLLRASTFQSKATITSSYQFTVFNAKLGPGPSWKTSHGLHSLSMSLHNRNLHNSCPFTEDYTDEQRISASCPRSKEKVTNPHLSTLCQPLSHATGSGRKPRLESLGLESLRLQEVCLWASNNWHSPGWKELALEVANLTLLEFAGCEPHKNDVSSVTLCTFEAQVYFEAKTSLILRTFIWVRSHCNHFADKPTEAQAYKPTQPKCHMLYQKTNGNSDLPPIGWFPPSPCSSIFICIQPAGPVPELLWAPFFFFFFFLPKHITSLGWTGHQLKLFFFDVSHWFTCGEPFFLRNPNIANLGSMEGHLTSAPTWKWAAVSQREKSRYHSLFSFFQHETHHALSYSEGC